MLTRRQPNDDSPRPEAMKRATNTFAFVSSSTEDARAAAKRLASIYGQTEIAEADVVVALGGDGFLLQTLRETMSTGKKVYGMNRGTVGFLMNEYREEGLPGRISAAIPETIRPLEMETATEDGTICHALAINEVALWRQSLSDGQNTHRDRRESPAGRIELRRGDGSHSRRFHRLQSVGARPHSAARCASPGADACKPIPPAAMARGAYS